MSNPNDLVIVRRGDVEALKQEAIFGVFRRDAVEWDKLNALIVNAPVVEQGEVVKPQFPTMLRKMWSGGEVQEWIDENWISSYTTPQQPQSVSDALEEVIEILTDKLSDSSATPISDAIEAIRALIKRNAEGEE